MPTNTERLAEIRKRPIYAKTSMNTLPNSCAECRLGERYGCVGDIKCRVLNEFFTGNPLPPHKERPDACPLVAEREVDRLTAERDRLDYTLIGVMYSVDKWLDGDELKAHPINRAVEMRAKTLRITEALAAELAALKEAQRWIPASEKLPDSGQEVFACYFDACAEDWQYEVVTYYRKGDPLYDEYLPDGDTGEERLLNAMFHPRARDAEEDGFYMYACWEGEYCRWRKLTGISHWKLPVPPEKEESRD